MNSFGDERPSVVAKRPPPPEPPNMDLIAGMQEEARLIGYDEGHAAGYADGLAIGRAEAAKELEHLQSIAATFGGALAEADETIASDMLELALQLARWGVTRVCPLGQMQNPPLTWRHDGRPALGDLVTWTDWEK